MVCFPNSRFRFTGFLLLNSVINLSSSGFDSWVAQGTPVNIIIGSHVWVEDPELAWIDGEVIEIKGNDATVVTTNERKVMF